MDHPAAKDPRMGVRNRPSSPAAAARNPGTALDLDWVNALRINTSAVERRASSLGGRRSVKKEWQAAWLLRAVRLMDLTSLEGDDTPNRVRRLAAKARQPVRADLLEALGAGDLGLRVGAVCVYPALIEAARAALEGSAIPVAAVAAGFPHGLSPLDIRVREVEAAVAAGADEVDIVVRRGHILRGDWPALYDEVRCFRDACGHAHLKTIIAVGELGTLRNVARASAVCMMAGADFIKTSTGKERSNATLPVGLTMIRTLRSYVERTGYPVGFKPAGGVRRAKDALLWLILMKEELGREWLEPERFRFGASSLLNDIERQLEHHVTGRYSASFHHPMA